MLIRIFEKLTNLFFMLWYIEWFRLEGTLKADVIPSACHGQGHLQLDHSEPHPTWPETLIGNRIGICTSPAPLVFFPCLCISMEAFEMGPLTKLRCWLQWLQFFCAVLQVHYSWPPNPFQALGSNFC